MALSKEVKAIHSIIRIFDGLETLAQKRRVADYVTSLVAADEMVDHRIERPSVDTVDNQGEPVPALSGLPKNWGKR